MTAFDVLITGGMVIDGRRNPRFIADVGVRDGLIAAIGNLAGAEATRTIDATGLNVAPGVIDLHTHYDSQVFWDPYCSTSGWHGVTSVVIGNCGFGFAPVRPEERDRAMLTMTRNEAVPLVSMQEGMPWDWVTFPEFLASLERTAKSVNVVALVPLNPLLVWVMGLERAKSGALPTDEEHAEMGRLLIEALDAGACGISAQRLGRRGNQRDHDGTPMATDLMHDETMLFLARILGERNEGVIQYTYVDFDALLNGSDGMDTKVKPHIEEVARISRRPVIVGGAGEGDLAWVAACQRAGLRIYAVYITIAVDGVSFTASLAESASAFDSVGDSSWLTATIGTVDEVKANLADPEVRARMRADLPIQEAYFGKLSDLVLLRAATPELRGFDETPLGHVAAALGHADCLDAFCEINIAEDLRTRWYWTMGGPGAGDDAKRLTEQGLALYRDIAEDPWAIPGISDGGAHTKYGTAGNYAVHFLTTYVRRHGWLSLEDAHWKLSALPAFAAGLTDRGAIDVGLPADLMIYDFERLGISEREEAHDYPAGEWRLVDRPIGLHHILVNGEVTMDHNTQTDVASGELLRHGRTDRIR